MAEEPESPLGRPESRDGALERLALHLQGMRSGMEQYTTGVRSDSPDALERWSALLDRYDAALVQAAVLLDVLVPHPPPHTSAEGRLLTHESRAQLEYALRRTGLRLDPP